MNTTQTQIKINLPLPLKEFLKSKAMKYGLPVSGYLKYLILKDIEKFEYPTLQASKKIEEAYKNALEDQKKNKLITPQNLAGFFDNL